jgi:hypothetical protein
MSDNFGVTPLAQHGGKRPGAGRPRKGEVREKPRRFRGVLNNGGSHSYAYITARLARDAQDGVKVAATLLAGIRDGRISAFAAGVEMNYCKRPEPTGRGSENMTKRRDWAMHRLLNPRPAPEKTPDVASGAEGKEESFR